MRNDPRGQERLRGIRFRNTARSGWPTTDRLKEMLPVGGRNGIPLVAVAAAAIIGLSAFAFSPNPGFEPSVAAHSLLALSSCQCFRRGLKLAPTWLQAFGRHLVRRPAFAMC